ncbi:GABA transporter 1 [Linum perenne]
MLTLAQIPSFHSLRHINLISLLLTLAYSACATAAAVHIGDNTQDRLFGVFNAVAIIATTYGNGIIPEIQATVAPPVKGKMFKGLVYLQPTNEVLESLFGDPKREQFSARNVVPRILSRSASVVLATTLAAMLPFFGDINAIIGAFGFIPLDFILPLVFYNLTFKPSKRSLVFWLNSVIAFVFAVVGAIAAVAAVRQIGLDANTYRLFANV